MVIAGLIGRVEPMMLGVFAEGVASVEGTMSLPVLVVDDDENIGKVFQMGFKEDGFQIVYFSSARAALEWAGEQKPVLAVVDVMMPEMNGVELCLALRDQPSTRDLPIILLSAVDRVELREAASLVGALSFVSKPFAPRQVFQIMRVHLANCQCH